MKKFKITAQKENQEFSYIMQSDDKPNTQQAFDYLVMHHPSKIATPPVHEPLKIASFKILQIDSI